MMMKIIIILLKVQSQILEYLIINLLLKSNNKKWNSEIVRDKDFHAVNVYVIQCLAKLEMPLMIIGY